MKFLSLNCAFLASMAFLVGCTLPRSIEKTPYSEPYFCLQARADTYLVRRWNLCPTFASSPRYLHWGGMWQLRVLTNENYLAKELARQDRIRRPPCLSST